MNRAAITYEDIIAAKENLRHTNQWVYILWSPVFGNYKFTLTLGEVCVNGRFHKGGYLSEHLSGKNGCKICNAIRDKSKIECYVTILTK